MYYYLLIKRNIHDYLLAVALLLFHLVWLYTIREQITQELVFPVWLLSSAKTFVSEIQTMYPPGLFHIVSAIYSLTENLRVSFYLVHIAIVICLDCILYIHLKSKFQLNIALSGFMFYICWQVFFRGNYLWFDLATIPFIAISFFYFASFIEERLPKDLILASLFLSFGNFFKNTTSWIFILYLLWIIILNFKKKYYIKNTFTHVIFLFFPPILVVTSNILFLAVKGSIGFAFYWSFIMAYLVFPRLQGLSRPITSSYLYVVLFLFVFYIWSCATIAKFSTKPKSEKWFLYTFPIAAFASILPRWSDFRLQAFVFFLTIIFTHALSLLKVQSFRNYFFFKMFLLVLLLFSFIIISNRLLIEINMAKLSQADQIREAVEYRLVPRLKEKSVFVYDTPFYNYEPLELKTQNNFLTLIKLIIVDPNLFYRITGPQMGLSYVNKKKPDFVIVHYKIQDQINSGTRLTDFEKVIVEKYHFDSKIGTLYSVYSRN